MLRRTAWRASLERGSAAPGGAAVRGFLQQASGQAGRRGGNGSGLWVGGFLAAAALASAAEGAAAAEKRIA